MTSKKILSRILKALTGSLLALILFAMAFINWAPQFGAQPSGDHLHKISLSSNYQDDHFSNLIDTRLSYSLSNYWGMIREYASAKNTAPNNPIPTHFGESASYFPDSSLIVTWFGHSAILLEVDGKRIFLDPMLGPNASPISFFGKRFKNVPPIDLETIDTLDAVIFSHDHYDHLDYYTISRLHTKVKHFYTPLGVGSHLQAWGVPADKISELDWWGHSSFGDFRLTATPARHFSGRSIGDANKTLWASWVIESPSHRIYFSGDSGYGPHFQQIGEKMGPFDFALIECGQYNDRWADIHMMPEQSIQASLDVKAKIVMPIHWGAFTLAPHEWTDPIERAIKAAEANNVHLITPEIGLPFSPDSASPDRKWWQAVK